jgi:hypothetical protein
LSAPGVTDPAAYDVVFVVEYSEAMRLKLSAIEARSLR